MRERKVDALFAHTFAIFADERGVHCARVRVCASVSVAGVEYHVELQWARVRCAHPKLSNVHNKTQPFSICH